MNTQKKVFFIIGDWNTKTGNEEIPGVTDKFVLGVQNETGQRLTEFCQENTLVITNTHFQVIQETTLHKEIATWSVLKSDCSYSLQLKMEKLYTVSKTRPGAYCGSDHQLLLQNSGSN